MQENKKGWPVENSRKCCRHLDGGNAIQQVMELSSEGADIGKECQPILPWPMEQYPFRNEPKIQTFSKEE